VSEPLPLPLLEDRLAAELWCIPFTTNSCSWALKFVVQIQKFKPHMVVRHKVLTIYSCSFVRATTDFFFKLGLKVPRLKILENTYQGSLDNRHVKFVWFEPVAQARPFYQLKKLSCQISAIWASRPGHSISSKNKICIIQHFHSQICILLQHFHSQRCILLKLTMIKVPAIKEAGHLNTTS
jgi:hypothetical protein